MSCQPNAAYRDACHNAYVQSCARQAEARTMKWRDEHQEEVVRFNRIVNKMGPNGLSWKDAVIAVEEEDRAVAAKETQQKEEKTQAKSILKKSKAGIKRKRSSVSFDRGTKEHDGLDPSKIDSKFDRLIEWYAIRCNNKHILGLVGAMRESKLKLGDILELPGYQEGEVSHHLYKWLIAYFQLCQKMPSGRHEVVLYPDRHEKGKEQKWVKDTVHWRHQVTPHGGGGGLKFGLANRSLAQDLWNDLMATRHGACYSSAATKIQRALRKIWRSKQ